MGKPKQIESSSERSFEEALKRLEEIVASLEQESPSLDASLALYEEGKSLMAICQQKLGNAEQKLRILTQGEKP